MSVANRAACGLTLVGFCAWLATGVPGWFGIALSVSAAIVVLAPLHGGNRMDTAPHPDVAGRVAFDLWRRECGYDPRWDWADMSTREQEAWIAHALSPGYVPGTQFERMTA